MGLLLTCLVLLALGGGWGVERATAVPLRTIQSTHRRLVNADSYLSGSQTSTYVDAVFSKKDDGSGRQRWELRSLGGGANNVVVSNGRTGPMFLSSTKDGSRVYLASKDDGSGLQRWQFKAISGREFEVSVFGGKGLVAPSANLLYVDGKTGKARLSARLAANATDRNRQLWTVLEPGTTAPPYTTPPATTAPPTASPKPSVPAKTIQNHFRSYAGAESYLWSSSATSVALSKTDDGSGRQRWYVESNGDGSFRVTVASGGILSVSADGKSVMLVSKEDGSGRQKWAFKNLYGGTYEISVFGGAGLTTPSANVLTVDGTLGLCLSVVIPVSNPQQSRQLWTVLEPGATEPPETLPPTGCPAWAHARTEEYVASRVAMLNDRAKQSFVVSQFGDSITARLDGPDFDDFMNYYTNYVGIPRSKFGNFGISGDTVQTMMHRLCNGGVPSGNEVVVFHIGTNNMRCNSDGSSPKQIAERAFASVDLVRRYNPRARVVVASIFNREMYPEKRAATNAEISRIVNERNDPNIFFTTAGEALTMNNTQSGDKLHPNPAGWRQIFDAGFGNAVKAALAKSPN